MSIQSLELIMIVIRIYTKYSMNCNILIATILIVAYSQNMVLVSEKTNVNIITDGVRNQSFYEYRRELDCGMPELYIYPDFNNLNYSIQTTDILINSITFKWHPISSSIECIAKNCKAIINNQCNNQNSKHQINWLVIDSSAGQVQYLIDCDPGSFYKPFEWGLLLLIMLCTLMLTLSSMFSTAWSYGGVGFEIDYKIMAIFNIIVFVGLVFAYQFPSVTQFVVRVAGSVLGALGVAVCVSEIIWLTHNKNYLKKFYKKIRIIDVISCYIGVLMVIVYWLLNGQWLINDVLATCTIVALIKLLKIRSLSTGVVLLGSLLLIEIMVGVFLHYVRKVSYNNWMINMFQSPIILVMPSITPELYRRCAWMPVSAVLFPGLVISYLRRFDKSRGTVVYFVIGLVSFYLGSICWMIADLQTVHSLPFAIISEPVTVFIVILQGFRRNELKTLWKGNFHDEELQEATEILLTKEKSVEIVGNGKEAEYPTENMTITAVSDEIEVSRQSVQFTL